MVHHPLARLRARCDAFELADAHRDHAAPRALGADDPLSLDGLGSEEHICEALGRIGAGAARAPKHDPADTHDAIQVRDMIDRSRGGGYGIGGHPR